MFFYYIFFGSFAFIPRRVFSSAYFLLLFYSFGIVTIIKRILYLDIIDLKFKIFLLVLVIGFVTIFIKCFHLRDSTCMCVFDYIKDNFNVEKDSIRLREDEFCQIIKKISPDSKIITIADNTPLLFLVSDIERSYSFNEFNIILEEPTSGGKVYLISNFSDYWCDFEKKLACLKLNRISLQRLNKIEINEDYDIYGVYELQMKDQNFPK